jgi:hypothetical protein
MWERFREGKETCERWLCDDLTFTLIVVVLVAISSFGLGRWSVTPVSTPERPVLVPELVTPPVAAVGATANLIPASETAIDGSLVASVNGTKFHALDCPGAKQISEQNKIYFTSEQEARAAGYTPAANCKF